MSPIHFSERDAAPAEPAFHDAAGIFDLLDGAEFDELVKDIRANGLKLPIILTDGKRLDGRNRYRACKAAGVDPIFRQWDGVGSPSDYVWSLNNTRRHLDGNARALAAGRYQVQLEAEGKARKAANLKNNSSKVPNGTIDNAGRSRTQAAEKFGLPERTVDRAAKVVKGGTPELQKAVAEDKVSVSAAAQIAALPAEKQQAIVASENPVAALNDEKKRVADFRASLPKPKEAKRLAKEKGGVFLATDGKYHSGSTLEEQAATDAFLSVFNWAADAADTENRVAPMVVASGCPDDTVDQFIGFLQDAASYLTLIVTFLRKRDHAKKS